MATNVIKITGMTCEGCTNSVEQTLIQFDGVDSVKADLETGDVTVEQDGSVPVDALKDLIVQMGFELA